MLDRRMPDKPTPEQNLASLLTSSGCTSLLDPKFARYLDACDPLGYMRYNYAFPSLESMTRQPEPESQPVTREEVMREHQELRDAKAGIKRSEGASKKPDAANEAQSQDVNGQDVATNQGDGQGDPAQQVSVGGGSG